MKKFPINGYGEDFFTGHCRNGDQVLMGLLCSNVVLFRFDREGRLVGTERRPWLYPAEQSAGICHICDAVFTKRLADQIGGWQEEIGFTTGRSEVEEFFDAEQYVGIELDENRGCTFVFWWAKEYSMDGAGEVEST
jgi:hypothetical protein